MTNYGIVDEELLKLLLSQYSKNYNRLIRLMVKFGLLVHLQSTENSGDLKDVAVQYLVPALLPPTQSTSSSSPWSDQRYSTCYLVFTTNKEFKNFTTITKSDLQVFGFLPQGLFERLLGKAVTWAQHTRANKSVKNFLLTQSMAILSFGSQRFRLRMLSDLCTIEVRDGSFVVLYFVLPYLTYLVSIYVAVTHSYIILYSPILYSPQLYYIILYSPHFIILYYR